jgi:hypothetical protein
LTSESEQNTYYKKDKYMALEFRELISPESRHQFCERVDSARASNGKRFRSSPKYRLLDQARVESCKLFGLFRSQDEEDSEIIAGIAMHDLQSYPQSCLEPDLSEFTPQSVVECSEHWSISSGAGLLAWAGLATPMRMLGVKAVLAYLATEDTQSDHAGFYSSMGFKRVGAAVRHPFIETGTGEHLRVQPVLLYGTALEIVIESFSHACLEVSFDARRFLLTNRIRPLVRRAFARPDNRSGDGDWSSKANHLYPANAVTSPGELTSDAMSYRTPTDDQFIQIDNRA